MKDQRLTSGLLHMRILAFLCPSTKNGVRFFELPSPIIYALTIKLYPCKASKAKYTTRTAEDNSNQARGDGYISPSTCKMVDSAKPGTCKC